MRRLRLIFPALLVGMMAVSAPAAGLACDEPSNVEEFRYSWRLRGGLGWIAGLIFPRTGVGNLKTVYPEGSERSISSELLITPEEGRAGGFYLYESEMDAAGQKTLVTNHGYAWGKKSRSERTIFDYAKRLARIHKVTPGKVEEKVRKMPDAPRDVLTAIHFLRQHADQIGGPLLTTVYSDGKEYPVLFRPTDRRTFTVDGERVSALGFEIVDAPGGKKWPGGVRIWLSNDARRIPLRIEIQQSIASMQLDLQSVESCVLK
ncbi:MAG TPA: DUF3108 domain-containing protein [Thermoanaerobaculia bacterium]|nr:DUF3108 domain-containing protein [Thermoanaerobaculia bacterium]